MYNVCIIFFRVFIINNVMRREKRVKNTVVGHLICISFFIHVAKTRSLSPRNPVHRSLSRDRVTCILNYIQGDDDDDDNDGNGEGQEYEYDDNADVLIVKTHNTNVGGTMS